MSAHDGSPVPVSTAVPAQPAPVFREPGTDVETDPGGRTVGLDAGLDVIGVGEHPASTPQSARPLRRAKRRDISGKGTRLRAERLHGVLKVHSLMLACGDLAYLVANDFGCNSGSRGAAKTAFVACRSQPSRRSEPRESKARHFRLASRSHTSLPRRLRKAPIPAESTLRTPEPERCAGPFCRVWRRALLRSCSRACESRSYPLGPWNTEDLSRHS